MHLMCRRVMFSFTTNFEWFSCSSVNQFFASHVRLGPTKSSVSRLHFLVPCSTPENNFAPLPNIIFITSLTVPEMLPKNAALLVLLIPINASNLASWFCMSFECSPYDFWRLELILNEKHLISLFYCLSEIDQYFLLMKELNLLQRTMIYFHVHKHYFD